MTDEDAGKFAEKRMVLLKKKDEILSRIHKSEVRLTSLKEELTISRFNREMKQFPASRDNAQNKHVFELSNGLSQMMGTLLGAANLHQLSAILKCLLYKIYSTYTERII